MTSDTPPTEGPPRRIPCTSCMKDQIADVDNGSWKSRCSDQISKAPEDASPPPNTSNPTKLLLTRTSKEGQGSILLPVRHQKDEMYRR